ncbi:hypothetical protein D3C84_867940 [compost metagenome]
MAGIGARRFNEHQRFGWRREGEFGSVIGIVQAEGKHGAIGRWQPLDLVFAEGAAVAQMHDVVCINRDGMYLTFESDTSVFHTVPSCSATMTLVRHPRPWISTSTRSPGRTSTRPKGVPVINTSPAYKVMNSLISAIN